MSYILIHDIILTAISEYLDGELLLCRLFDLVVAPSEEEVVDGGGQPAEKDHQDAEEHQVLQDVDCWDEVLEHEEGLGHGVE